jgi:hypothetical protein
MSSSTTRKPVQTPNQPTSYSDKFKSAADSVAKAANSVADAAKAAADAAKAVKDTKDSLTGVSKRMKTGGYKTGGGCACRGILGGSSDELINYKNTFQKEARDKYLGALREYFAGLGVNFNGRTDMENVMKEINAALKSINNDGSTNKFNQNVSTQSSVFPEMVKLFNNSMKKTFGNDYTPIDENDSKEIQLASMIQYTKELATGAIQDNATAKKVATELVENIQSSITLSSEIFKKIADAKKKEDTMLVKKLYEKAQNTLKENLDKLSAFLAVNPTVFNTTSAFIDNGLVYTNGQVELRINSEEFGDGLAYLLSFLKTNTELTAEIQTYLTKFGTTITDALENMKWEEFDELIRQYRLNSNASPDEIDKYQKAVTTMRLLFQALTIKKGGVEMTHGTKSSKSYAEIQKEKAASSLVILKEYTSAMTSQYNKLFQAVTKFVGDMFEKGLRIDTYKFSTSISNVATLMENNPKIDLELLELSEFISSKTNKESYVGYFDSFKSAVRNLCDQSKEIDGSTINSCVDEIMKTISHFSQNIKHQNVNFDANQLFSMVQKNNTTIRKGIYKVVYDIYIYNMKLNFSNIHKEIEGYTENYEHIMGEALSTIIKVINDETNDTNKINDTGGDIVSAKKEIVDQNKIRINFYKALQAIDLFLKKFTLSTTKIPSAITAIQKVLLDTQMISNWYSDDTGETLAALFDTYQKILSNVEHRMAVPNVGNTISDIINESNGILSSRDHYYNKSPFPLSGRNNHNLRTAIRIATTNKITDNSAEYRLVKDLGASVYDKFQGLKNIVNMFVRISLEEDANSDIFMTPSQIYTALIDYVKISTFRIETTVGAAGARPSSSLVMKKHDNANNEDKLFVSAIKSMATKIVTTLKLIEMQKEPISHCDLIRTRLVIGGDYEKLEIIPDASDFYFRLPRLAEFYIDTLFPQQNQAFGDLTISVVPDIEGVFSELIRYLYRYKMDLAPNTDFGNYMESEVRDIIIIVNKIYKFYSKDGSASVNICINDFIKNMNRKYGLLSREEIQKVHTNLKKSRDSVLNSSVVNNVSILPGEDSPSYNDYYSRSAPSDRFASGKLINTGQYDIISAKNAIDNFIKNINEKLRTCNEAKNYRNFIKQHELEIRSSKTDESKLAHAVDLINCSSSTNRNTVEMLLFHETVISGLQALYSIYKRLNYEETNEHVDGERILDHSMWESNIVPPLAPLAASYVEFKRAINYLAITASGDEPMLDFKYQNNTIILNFNKIKNQCESTLHLLKNLINKFRNNISYETIELYEKIGVGADKISISKIQDMLFNTLFSTNQAVANSIVTTAAEINRVINYANTDTRFWHRLIYGSQFEILRYVSDDGFDNLTLIPECTNLHNSPRGMSNSIIKNVQQLLDSYIRIVTGQKEPMSGINEIPYKSIYSNIILPYYNSYIIHAITTMSLKYKESLPTQGLNQQAKRDLVQRTHGNIVSTEDKFFPYYVAKTADSIIKGPSTVNQNAIAIKNAYISNILSEIPSMMKDLIKLQAPMLINAITSILHLNDIIRQIKKPVGLATSFVVCELLPQYTCADQLRNLIILGFIEFDVINPQPANLAIMLAGVAFPIDRNGNNGINNINAFMADIGPAACANILRYILFSGKIINEMDISVGSELVFTIVGIANNVATFTYIDSNNVNTIAPIAIDPQFDDRAFFDIISTYAVPHIDDVPIAQAGRRLCRAEVEHIQVEATFNSIEHCLVPLNNIMKQCLKEIGDNPVFMELYENHMDILNMDKKTQNVCMPLSVINTLSIDVSEEVPVERILYNSQIFGPLYGSRFILNSNQKIKSHHIPNSIKFLNIYNSLNSDMDQIPENMFIELMQNITDCNRFVFKGSKTNGFVIPVGVIDSIIYSPEISMIASDVFKKQNIIDNIYKKCNGSIAPSNPRFVEQLSNIIELNVMPINISSLMQSIPLINVLNYSAAFNVLFDSIYGKYKTPTLEIMERLTTNPYANFDDYSPYKSKYQNYFLGGDNHIKDRPKFISDQIYMKSLFGTIKQCKIDQEIKDIRPDTRVKFEKFLAEIYNLALTPYITNDAEYNNWITEQGTLREVLYRILDGFKRRKGLGQQLNVQEQIQYLLSTITFGVEYSLIREPNKIYTLLNTLLSEQVTSDTVKKIIRNFPFGQTRCIVSKYSFGLVLNAGGTIYPTSVYTLSTVIANLFSEILWLFRSNNPNAMNTFDRGINQTIKNNASSPTAWIYQANHDERFRILCLIENSNRLLALPQEERMKFINGINNGNNDRYAIYQSNEYDFSLDDSNGHSIQLAFYPSNGNNDYFEEGNEQLTDSYPEYLLKGFSDERFNTVITRNLLFISNIQRILRLAISRTINVNNDPLLTSNSIANSSATEYGHDPFTKLEQINDPSMISSSKYEGNRLL